MEWEEKLRERVEDNDDQAKIHQLCYNAFVEGCQKERNLAIEAYRLRCKNLFGNRCMNYSRSKSNSQAICHGNCSYIRQYEFELYKQENQI